MITINSNSIFDLTILKAAKKIVLKPNKDGTFNIAFKTDVYDENTEKSSVSTISFLRTKINLDINILAQIEEV